MHNDSHTGPIAVLQEDDCMVVVGSYDILQKVTDCINKFKDE